jgi:FkbH-like protein
MPLSLSQALAMIVQQDGKASHGEIFLVCGFQPLHLATFLKAYFAVRFPQHSTEILTGVYGDLDGGLDKAHESDATAAAVVIEWADLDPRLGLRSAGGWGPSVEQDIVENCAGRWSGILGRLDRLVSRMPVALSPPSLPIRFFGHTAGWQLSVAEAELQKQVAAFLADAARIDRVRILHPSRLTTLSPEASRCDPKLELAAGFPYKLEHASVLASQLIQSLYPLGPTKGLITDLDGTLWSGITGEAGAGALTWSLSDRAQVHGLYQQQLRQFSEMGVLLAIASKSEMPAVEEALRRDDLYVPASSFFPVKAGWGPKSRAASEILDAWNIGPESVVFVDDSRMEIEEVRAVFPSMTCLQFPTGSPALAVQLFEQLRDLFGKPALYREDILRQASLRSQADFNHTAGQLSNGSFVRELKGRITIDARKDRDLERLLELINKTNQFNLNGRRVTEGEWLRHLNEEQTFAAGVSYEDKFGPLGLIAVIAGRQHGGRVEVTNWVLSCRAFSRKIEHHMLHYLTGLRDVGQISLEFHPTERNGYLRKFLGSMGLDCVNPGNLELTDLLTARVDSDLAHEVRILESD